MYPLSAYASMFADPVRTNAYADALRRTVKPGDVVLEVGTGPGLFAVYAARLGARKVYAVDPSPTVAIAREVIRSNGVADRVLVVQSLLEDLELPEQVDVVVSDLRGIVPPHGNHLRTVMLARDRDLRPGGTLIPGVDRLHVSVVSASQAHQRLVGRWGESYLDIDLSYGQRIAASAFYKLEPSDVHLASDAAAWAVLDYAKTTSTRVAGEATLTVCSDCEGHGLLVWFDTTLVEGVGYSNAPDQPRQVYGVAFFPWMRPARLTARERVLVRMRADLIGGNYVWSWKTQIGVREDGTCRERFDQTTFDGEMITGEQIARVNDRHVPALSSRGEVERFILMRVDGRRTNADLADVLAEAELPGVPDRNIARFVVNDVITRLGR